MVVKINRSYSELLLDNILSLSIRKYTFTLGKAFENLKSILDYI